MEGCVITQLRHVEMSSVIRESDYKQTHSSAVKTMKQNSTFKEQRRSLFAALGTEYFAGI
jgi:hypothetical protein